MAEVIGLLGGRYSESDGIVEVSIVHVVCEQGLAQSS